MYFLATLNTQCGQVAEKSNVWGLSSESLEGGKKVSMNNPNKPTEYSTSPSTSTSRIQQYSTATTWGQPYIEDTKKKGQKIPNS
jgi:hypothetical protein